LRRFFWIDAATALIIFAVKHAADHCCCTPNTRLNEHGTDRAIATASAAFHAGITIPDLYVPFIHRQYPMRADFQTQAAAGACIRINTQVDHIL
jgi:hypothetical protein